MKMRMVMLAGVMAALGGGAALAQDVVAEREAMMKAMGARMAVLMGMGTGRSAYDAASATTAAAELAALAAGDWAPLFPEGTDMVTLGKGRALPAVWENMDGFLAEKQALADAAAALELAAANGADAIRAAGGALGATCSSCHQGYRR